MGRPNVNQLTPTAELVQPDLVVRGAAAARQGDLHAIEVHRRGQAVQAIRAGGVGGIIASGIARRASLLHHAALIGANRPAAPRAVALRDAHQRSGKAAGGIEHPGLGFRSDRVGATDQGKARKGIAATINR